MHFHLLMGLGVSCIRCYTCSPCNDFRKDAKLVQCPKSTTSCITEIFESVGKNNSSKVSGKISMAEIKKMKNIYDATKFFELHGTLIFSTY